MITTPLQNKSKLTCDTHCGATEGTRKKTLLYVDAEVDDYGFTPIQLRVLCHISRRGECYASIENIAARCMIHVNSVRPTLRFLIAYKIIQETRRPGHTTIYNVRPYDEWIPLEQPPQSNRGPGRPKVIPPPPHKESTSTPLQNNSDEVHPSEVTPLKGNETSPPVHSVTMKLLRQRLYLREYDKYKADAKKLIKEYRGNPANYVNGKLKPEFQSVVDQLEARALAADAAKFEMNLPENKPAPSSSPPKKLQAPDQPGSSNDKAELPPEVLAEYIRILRAATK
jgi:hypothetical protein